MLLLADQARAGESLGFCISDQIQAADDATPTPRPTHHSSVPQESRGRLASQLSAGPRSLPLGRERAAQLVLSYPVSGHCSHTLAPADQPGSASSSALPSGPTGPRDTAASIVHPIASRAPPSQPPFPSGPPPVVPSLFCNETRLRAATFYK